MKLIVGLGNPGKKYQNNRHNVGHMMVDYVLDKLEQYSASEAQRSREVNWVKTDVFMNQSGQAVKKLLENWSASWRMKIENLIVVHDDLDIPLGKFKIEKGTGPRLHNGINSIEEALGTQDFWRVRIGVDTRVPGNWVDGETYVLQNFSPKERKVLANLLPKIFERLLTIIDQ